jgi:hypothetical protein
MGVRWLSIALASVTALLAACGTPATNPQRSLAGACQFEACTCADNSAAFWQKPATRPVIWREQGMASCPEGFHLQRTAGKP